MQIQKKANAVKVVALMILGVLGLAAIAVSLCVEPGSPRNFAAAAHEGVELIFWC